jgi:hypothetical protein
MFQYICRGRNATFHDKGLVCIISFVQFPTTCSLDSRHAVIVKKVWYESVIERKLYFHHMLFLFGDSVKGFGVEQNSKDRGMPDRINGQVK